VHQVYAIFETYALAKNKWHYCIRLKILVPVANFHDFASDLGQNIELIARLNHYFRPLVLKRILGNGFMHHPVECLKRKVDL